MGPERVKNESKRLFVFDVVWGAGREEGVGVGAVKKESKRLVDGAGAGTTGAPKKESSMFVAGAGAGTVGALKKESNIFVAGAGTVVGAVGALKKESSKLVDGKMGADC